MGTTRRIVASVLSIVTALLAVWTAAGWVMIGTSGGAWSDAIALTVFSVVLVVLALICSALWRAHVRGLSVSFAIVAALAVVSLVASLV